MRPRSFVTQISSTLRFAGVVLGLTLALMMSSVPTVNAECDDICHERQISCDQVCWDRFMGCLNRDNDLDYCIYEVQQCHQQCREDFVDCQYNNCKGNLPDLSTVGIIALVATVTALGAFRRKSAASRAV